MHGMLPCERSFTPTRVNFHHTHTRVSRDGCVLSRSLGVDPEPTLRKMGR